VEKPDQIFPLFVMQVMGDIPCIPGLFVAGVFSGALSTVSSGLNALAAVTFQDFIQGGCGLQMEEKKKTIVSKCLAVGYGILSYAIVFLVKYLPGVLEVKYINKYNHIT
jgi:Na+/proline symporter